VDADEFGLTVTAVQRWLSLNRDVLVRGDRGAGKTAVLQALLADASRRGEMGILLPASGSRDFAALLDHASSPVRLPDEAALTDWLAGELRSRKSLLLVDDIDRMDDASLAVVRRVLGRTGALLVASSTGDPLRAVGVGMRDVLHGRSLTEVRMQPLGFRSVAELLQSALGAPADAGLTSSVMAGTGGNPRAVLALADAGRAAGALHLAHGHWTADGTLGEVPVDAVAYVFLAGLAPAQIDALEALAGAGPVPADVAARVVDPGTLEELTDHGRVVAHQLAGSGDVLAVSPPLLARALRDRVSPFRRRKLAERIHAEGGAVAAETPPTGDDISVLLTAPSGAGRAPRWAAQVTGLVHERTTAEEAARRAEWQQDPNLPRANAYLAALMHRPAVEQLEEVFARTAPGDGDDPGDRALFALYRARWTAWSHTGTGPGRPPADGLQVARDADLAVGSEIGQLKQRILHQVHDGRSPDEIVAEPDPPAGAPFLRGWAPALRAAALLEAGWPAAALEVVLRADVSDAGPEPRHYLAALHGHALLYGGRVLEAEQWQRRMLDTAYDEVDMLGIRVHACALAEVLFASTQGAAAWRAVSTSLRLGAPGPIGTTFYRRGLTVGAMVQAHAGNLTLANVLVRELDRTPPAYRPLLRSMRPLAHAAIAAASGDPGSASRLSRAAARHYEDERLLQPALMCWTLSDVTLDAERAEAVGRLSARTRVPVLDPYVRSAVARAQGDRKGTSRPPRPRPAAAPAEPLTARELEVAAFAREGLSNREIADELHLSVRTVENHMNRVFRKLGLTSRHELAGWSDPARAVPNR
jgi:DNA-binding CsgD family transcriptional regulator